MRRLRIGVVIGLLATIAACGGDDATTSSTQPTTTVAPSTSTTSTTAATDTSAPATTTSTTSAPTTTQPTPTTTPTTTPPTTTPPTELVDVRVYFLRGERLVIAHRQVAPPAVLRGALTELLKGPTAAERAAGLTTTIPAGTTLLDVDLSGGLATVDLSDQFDDGGGTLSMTTRVGEVVFTATQFDNSDAVRFWMEGEPIEYLGGEGLIMSDPWTRLMVGQSISGSVIIDTPAHGATVGNPFTVTGEGDVYEGQFPIEVWRDGVQIGGIAPVWAGAWGEWADFEVTITLDAPPGPIELVAYDEGGCGTGPECPEIITTVVPLTFTG